MIKLLKHKKFGADGLYIYWQYPFRTNPQGMFNIRLRKLELCIKNVKEFIWYIDDMCIFYLYSLCFLS